MKTDNETPRRIRLDLNEPAELAIHKAMQEVEKLPPDVRLTLAGVKLQEAKNLVADFMDSVGDSDDGQMQRVIYVYFIDGRIEKMTRKQWYYNDAGTSGKVFMWNNKENDTDWKFIDG